MLIDNTVRHKNNGYAGLTSKNGKHRGTGRKAVSYLFIKRLTDLFFSIIIILFFLTWLIPLISMLIIFDSGFPVLFVQRRVGFAGRSFKCFKFRTMVVNDEADDWPAKSDDPRITRAGKFLRFSSLDELPQFFNVLIGNMSLVGPRPHMHKDCRSFSAIISNYKIRNFVKPGITGLAQINGLRGPSLEETDVINRFKSDVLYVQKASLLLDLKIMAITFYQEFGILRNAFKAKRKGLFMASRNKFRQKNIHHPSQSTKEVA